MHKDAPLLTERRKGEGRKEREERQRKGKYLNRTIEQLIHFPRRKKKKKKERRIRFTENRDR
jgi:hypothetical protein